MSIFKIKDNKVIIDPILLVIPEFKSIWDRDSTRDKATAYQELTYIYFMSEQRKDKNPYIDYPADSKASSIIRGHITIPNWNADSLVQAAIEKNIEFQIKGNSALRFLNSIKGVMEKLISKFESIDVDERDEKDKPIYKFADIMNATAKAKDMITTIEALEEKVLREDLTKKTKSKNNTQASDYEV
jgi:hypothetical protein